MILNLKKKKKNGNKNSLVTFPCASDSAKQSEKKHNLLIFHMQEQCLCLTQLNKFKDSHMLHWN